MIYHLLSASDKSFILLAKIFLRNGDGEIRTLDPLLARQVLSQLSYAPIWYFFLL